MMCRCKKILYKTQYHIYVKQKDREGYIGDLRVVKVELCDIGT